MSNTSIKRVCTVLCLRLDLDQQLTFIFITDQLIVQSMKQNLKNKENCKSQFPRANVNLIKILIFSDPTLQNPKIFIPRAKTPRSTDPAQRKCSLDGLEKTPRSPVVPLDPTAAQHSNLLWRLGQLCVQKVMCR
uniref:Uncharacterized protein n=1 Tax=Echeneis naucrates TaxID=173247 RepID=A0A665VU20_ECHNA